jgi:hypothetical protein
MKEMTDGYDTIHDIMMAVIEHLRDIYSNLESQADAHGKVLAEVSKTLEKLKLMARLQMPKS